ncbi:MAG: molybdopterin molybdotransferase MoeA [Clostridia bacterium]|nr:molybdopterin molybdotransferase MoeA [Clostridia bacterium]
MLNVISLNQAIEIAEHTVNVAPPETERLPLCAAFGRVLGEDIESGENVPSFDRSTMDGFAVCAQDTFGASGALPAMLDIVGEVGMGERTDLALSPGECVKIPTGGMLPAGADAVVPVECTDAENGVCLVYASVSPLQNVTRAGDDVAFGQTVLKKGALLTPAAVGVLASMGREEVAVFQKLRVGVLSTGNELVNIGQTPDIGQVRDVNSHLLASLVSSFGCEPVNYGIIKDDEGLLSDAITRTAAANDILLLSGGSSAGDADRTAALVQKYGTLFCHGIAVKPGKPTVLGQIGSTPVFGLPGHPAACFFMAQVLVKRHVFARMGRTDAALPLTLPLSEHVSSNHGREELLCVRIENGFAVPVYAKSGVISLLTAAHGYTVIPREKEGLAKGAEVLVYPFV